MTSLSPHFPLLRSCRVICQHIATIPISGIEILYNIFFQRSFDVLLSWKIRGEREKHGSKRKGWYLLGEFVFEKESKILIRNENNNFEVGLWRNQMICLKTSKKTSYFIRILIILKRLEYSYTFWKKGSLDYIYCHSHALDRLNWKSDRYRNFQQERVKIRSLADPEALFRNFRLEKLQNASWNP